MSSPAQVGACWHHCAPKQKHGARSLRFREQGNYHADISRDASCHYMQASSCAMYSYVLILHLHFRTSYQAGVARAALPLPL